MDTQSGGELELWRPEARIEARVTSSYEGSNVDSVTREEQEKDPSHRDLSHFHRATWDGSTFAIRKRWKGAVLPFLLARK